MADPQLDALVKAGLQSILVYPSDAEYSERQNSYWAANAALGPKAIVLPRTPEDVSRAVKALAEVDGKAVVRSGGHMQWAGANDIHDGVTIDLGRMTNVTYDSQTKLASVQPGARWGDVYDALEPYGVCAAGGRDADVGVGGFLTGGGNSYYSGRMGMGCDSVANFEVVLANGDIVNANATENPDLWKALKGGSGNFGIVTRFDLKTVPATPLWGGMRASPRSAGDDIAQTLVDFTNDNEKNPETAYIINYTYNPSVVPDVVIASVVVDTLGKEDAPIIENIKNVPTLFQDVKTRTISDITKAYVLPSGLRQTWFTLSFKNDGDVVKKAGEMHDQLVEELKAVLPPQDFVTQCLFQPLPTFFAKRSVEQGGNVLGLDSVPENALLWLLTGTVKTEEHERIMEEKLGAFAKSLEEYAKSKGSDIAWLYSNYTDKTQSPFSSYGAANIDFLRKVSTKYDPNGVFQNKIVGGFKLPKN